MKKLNNNVEFMPDFNDKLKHREILHQAVEIVVRIDEEIREVSYYGDVIERMLELSPNDTVRIVVNTVGGSLQSTLAIINAIQNTEAEVVCVIEGDASSGGSAIALSCPNVAVSPYATLFIHAASGFTGGKMNEHAAMFNFNHKWTSDILRDIYKGFLTESELTEMLEGKDFYFNANEIIERLEKRSEYWQALADAEEAEEEPEVKPKRKRKKQSEE